MTQGWQAPGEQPGAQQQRGAQQQPGAQQRPGTQQQPGTPPQQAPVPQHPTGSGWGAPPPGGPDLTKPAAPPHGPQPTPPQGQRYGYGYGPMAPAAPLAPRPGVIPLRPLSLGEIYDGAFQAMRRNPGPMIGSAAVVGALMAVVTAVFTLVIGSELVPLLDPATASTVSEDEVVGTLGVLGGGVLVVLVVTLLGVAVLSGVLVLPVSRAVTGQRTTFGEVWRTVWTRIWSLLGLIGLSALVVLGIYVLLLVPALLAIVTPWLLLLYLLAVPAAFLAGCWWLVRSTIALPAVMLEGAGPATAWRRAGALAGGLFTGPFWRTFGILLLAAVIVGVAQQLLGFPAVLVSGGIAFANPGDPAAAAGLSAPQILVTSIATIVASAVVYPFQAGVGTLLYVDHRMRREGLDVELARAASR